MKIYAELYGDIQKPRIKNRGDNTMDVCNTMAQSISKASKVVDLSAISESIKPAISSLDTLSYGATAIKALKVGDRPYRVNSGDISSRQS